MFDVVDCTLAVIAPTEDGAESKCKNTEGKQRSADIRNLGECYLCQCCPVGIADIGMGQNTANEHQTRKGTNDDRVPESTCTGNQSLTNGRDYVSVLLLPR